MGVGEDTLDHHNTFTTAYSDTQDKSLTLHVDDSEITVNYCLGIPGFQGCLLEFNGVRCRIHYGGVSYSDKE